jgi:hypothetical protein
MAEMVTPSSRISRGRPMLRRVGPGWSTIGVFQVQFGRDEIAARRCDSD